MGDPSRPGAFHAVANAKRERVGFTAVTRVWVLLPVAMAVAATAFVPGARSTGAAAARPCRAQVSNAVLPVWARGGFSGPKPSLPHVFGESGRIVGILFGYPLRSPVGPNRNNKILWVSRTRPKTAAALWIRAQRMDGDQPAGAPIGQIVRGGPGPSIVDVPQAGCWRLTLSWSGRTDTLDLAYSAGN